MTNKNIRPEKQAMAAELKDKISGSLYVLLADFNGLDMSATNDLRTQLRGADAEFHIVKNRLFGKVAEGMELGLNEEALKGQTGMVTGSGDVVEVAKILKTFAAAGEARSLKGGAFEGKCLSANDVKALAELPPKEVLQSKLVGTLAAPMTNLVGVMDQKVASLVYVLAAVQRKKEEA
ncbi:50S ribosomal protein L10 [Verrucomicrobiota bacterium]